MKGKQIFGIIVAALLIVVVGYTGVTSARGVNDMIRNTAQDTIFQLADSEPTYNAEPTDPNIAVVFIVGTIGYTEYNIFGQPVSAYVHDRILSLIYDMQMSRHNKGLLLYIDSGGGAVLESDEVYLALMEYKEATGRPIYTYCADTMASGAYYIACASDKIYANRNGIVGSIGVYIETVNLAKYYEDLGVEGEYIRSGPNKAMGNEFEPLTDEQRSIYQGVVDECYEQFLGIVCDARGYTREQLLPIADGRIYTAQQGVSNGLIDGLSNVEDTLAELAEVSGANTLYFREYTTPGFLGWLGMMAEGLPKSEAETVLDLIEQQGSGRPMYYYAG